MPNLTGKCLCGSVCYTLKQAPQKIGLCHCKMCRRWGGGLPLAVISGEVALESADALSWWKSSEWGERGFCKNCGTSLFWRVLESDRPVWSISVGTLDDDTSLTVSEHIFIDDKGGFYELADNAPRLRGAEFTARVLSELATKYGDGFLADVLEKFHRQSGEAFANEVKQLMGKN